jgi:rubrerythrin
MYFVIYDTVHLFQNYSVDECETEEEAFNKLDEAKKLHNWSGWVVKEVERPTQALADVSKWNCPQCGFINIDDERACFACGAKRG